MRALAVLLVVICVSGIAAIDAQDGQKPPTSTFRTSTRLIQVSVVVHEGKRKPVEGLKAEDFQVFEDGNPKPVAFFSVEGSTPSPVKTTSSAVFTNRVESPGGGVVAIVFDRLNTAQFDQARVRDAIVRFLGQVNPEDRIGLYVLDRKGMGIVHDFTRDARSLIRVLGRIGNKDSAAVAGSEETPIEHVGFGDALDAQLEAFAQSGFASIRSLLERERALTSIEGLEAVAAHLQGVPGRKNLIWISSGFPFEFRAFQPAGNNHMELMSRETVRAARALNDADAAVYVVDARGLVGAFATSPSSRTQVFTTLDSALRPIEGLRQFAQLTGGDAFFNTNDLGAAIGRAVEDSRLTYVLGYYSDETDWDGKFRRIQVKVRRDGVSVRHRAGYLAIPRAGVPQTRGEAILDALANPLEATAVPVTVAIEPSADRVTLVIRIGPGTPLFEKRGNTWHGAVDIAVAQTLSDGRQTADADITIPFELDDTTRAQLLKDGLRLTRTIGLRDDAHDVRVVVRDPSSGAVGSVIIPAAIIRAGSSGNRQAQFDAVVDRRASAVFVYDSPAGSYASQATSRLR